MISVDINSIRKKKKKKLYPQMSRDWPFSSILLKTNIVRLLRVLFNCPLRYALAISELLTQDFRATALAVSSFHIAPTRSLFTLASVMVDRDCLLGWFEKYLGYS